MARILKRSQKGKESAVPIENEYKSFLELKTHLTMLKNGLPYFEESIHSVMEILNIKKNLLSEHKDDVYRLGSTYQTSPFELVDTVPIKKALDADQMELHSLKKEIRECSIKLDKYRYQWQTIIKSPKEMIQDFFLRDSDTKKIFDNYIDKLQERLDHLKLFENGYYLESCRLNCFFKDMNYYKEHYEKDLVEYKDKIKMYERICEPESRLVDCNKYLGMEYQNISVDNIKKMAADYENILNERISQVDEKIKEIEKTSGLCIDNVDMISDSKIQPQKNEIDENRKDAILHCMADETLEYVYNRTATGFIMLVQMIFVSMQMNDLVLHYRMKI